MDLTDITWEECGESDPQTRLLATIRVHGCPLHLEARQVCYDDHGLQTFVEYPEDYGALCALYSCDAPEAFHTFTRNGREYVPFTIPFQR